MYRKVLITALMLSIGMVGFSKTEKIRNVNPKELAKTVAENSSKELLDKMQRRLKDRNEKYNLKFGNNKTEGQQFLYQENLIDSVLKAESHLLTDVYKKLCEESNMPTDLVYEGININNIAYKTFQKKGMEMVDSTTLIVPVSFQAHTVTKDGLSDVKYAITFKWEMNVKTKTENTVVDDKKTTQIVYVQNGTPTLVASVANPVKYLTSDKKAMKNAAQNAIIEWYANLPQSLDKQYVEQSVSAIKAMNNISSNDIVVNLPDSQNFTITEVPTINVDIDPYQFIKDEDKPLYTNPAAYIIVAPVFNVSVEDSFKNANLAVSYVVKETVKPIADKENELRRSKANAAIAEFAKQLSTFVTSRDAEQKTYIESLFDSADSNVEVSHLPKRGPEIIKKKSAQKYLSLLRGSSLNFHIDNIEIVNLNLDSLIYTVNQEYQSKTYSDYTQKRIYMTYDSSKGAYVINKIEVVPNSTIIQ